MCEGCVGHDVGITNFEQPVAPNTVTVRACVLDAIAGGCIRPVNILAAVQQRRPASEHAMFSELRNLLAEGKIVKASRGNYRVR